MADGQNTQPMPVPPHFGHTKHGLPVHLRVADYHAAGTAYQAANRKIALWITQHVGTMSCFWAFSVLALLSLPATLKEANVHISFLYAAIPAFFLTFGFIYLVTWVCQNYIQLVLLPALMVGQNLQSEASDARSAKQFEDTEVIVDRLDERTQGGIQVLAAALARIEAKLDASVPQR